MPPLVRGGLKPALAKVTIYEVASRSWGWLTTRAEVDDRVYVGTPEWYRRQKEGGNDAED
jgi:hypothetical protein